MTDQAEDKTLIVQPLPGIGDLIWNLPFIHAVAARRAEGRVTLLTKRRSAADVLLSGDPRIEEIIWLERQKNGPHAGFLGSWRLAMALQKRRFSTVWILHRSPRYAIIAQIAGIQRRIGYGTRSQRLWLSHGCYIADGKVPAHPIDAGRKLLLDQGVPPAATGPLLLVDPARLDVLKNQYGFLPDGTNVALGIGSSEAFKLWPNSAFADLIGLLGPRGARTKFFLFGAGQAERAIARDIIAETAKAGLDVVEVIDAPLDQVVHLLSAAQLFVGNDSGLLNVAAALGVPALGLFGASPPLPIPEIRPVVPESGAPNRFDTTGAGMRLISPEQVCREIEMNFPNVFWTD